MAFPYGISVLDPFSGGVGSVGANWTRVSGWAALDLQVGAAANVTGNAGQFTAMVWNVAQYGPDSAVKFQVDTTNASDNLYVLMRLSGTTYYQFHFVAGSWDVLKVVAGTPGSTLASGSHSVANTEYMGFEAIGTASTILKAFHSPDGSSWSEVFNFTDSSSPITAAGYIGLGIEGNNWRLDDFAAGTVVGATPPVAAYSGTPLTIRAGQATVFSDASTNTPTSWAWQKKRSGGSYVNFEGTPTAQNPTETFSVPGVYDITLTATNASGSDPEEKLAYVTVLPPYRRPTIDRRRRM